MPYTRGMNKSSVYLEHRQIERLAKYAREEGRSRAEILRDAIDAYRPKPRRDRNFALANGFTPIDGDQRPISEIPEDELLEGFGS